LRTTRPKRMELRRVSRVGRQAAVLALPAFLALLFCPPLAAQRLPALEVWGGYSHLRFEATKLGFSDQLDLNGWNGGLSLPHIVGGLGVSADVSGHYTPELEEYNFLIGPQYSFEWKRMRLYGHGLFGKSRNRLRQPGSTRLEPSSLGRAIATGGGVDVSIWQRFSLRAVQADYLLVKSFGTTQHNLRFSTGLIYRFGKP
jgi:hypothetical protein